MDLFRNGSLEQLTSVLSGNRQLGSQVTSSSTIYLQTLHGYTSSSVLLQRNIPSGVCFSKTSVHLYLPPGKHSFTCLPQQNTIWHNWFSKEPLGFHFIQVMDCYSNIDGSEADGCVAGKPTQPWLITQESRVVIEVPWTSLRKLHWKLCSPTSVVCCFSKHGVEFPRSYKFLRAS